MRLRNFVTYELIFIVFIFINNKLSNTETTEENFESTIPSAKEDMTPAKKLYALDFEVFGRVQGVFFRKYTEKQANTLGVRGWCENTPEGTVKGQMEGPQNQVNEMKHWLQTRGSPKSRISNATFTEMKEIPEYTYKAFSIRR